MMSVELEQLPLFPCGPDKRPLVAHGFKSAVAGRNRIDDIHRQHPGALMATPTGCASGFDVLDIDRGGEDWLALYEATHGLPSTRIVATRSGGLHLYFRHRVGMKCSAGLLAPNVDIRSTGGYVILWHLAGCRVLSDAPIAPWPGPMLQLLHETEETRRERYTTPAPSAFHVSSSSATANKGYVPKPLYIKIIRLMGDAPIFNQVRVRGILRPLVEARENRNQTLYRAALQFRELIGADIISRAHVEELLYLSAELNGYVAKRGKKQTEDTIKSGLDAKRYGREILENET
jgi:hypothetical protein